MFLSVYEIVICDFKVFSISNGCMDWTQYLTAERQGPSTRASHLSPTSFYRLSTSAVLISANTLRTLNMYYSFWNNYFCVICYWDQTVKIMTGKECVRNGEWAREMTPGWTQTYCRSLWARGSSICGMCVATTWPLNTVGLLLIFWTAFPRFDLLVQTVKTIHTNFPFLGHETRGNSPLSVLFIRSSA